MVYMVYMGLNVWFTWLIWVSNGFAFIYLIGGVPTAHWATAVDQETTDALLTVIPEAELPVEYGGTCTRWAALHPHCWGLGFRVCCTATRVAALRIGLLHYN